MRAGRRRAARRARGRHGHVRRQPQHQRLERLHRRLRVLRLRAGQALARRLRARRARSSSRRVRRGGRLRRDRDLHPVGHPPRLERSRTTSAGCGSPRRPRRSSTCTRTARWRSRTCATSPACRRARSSRGCARRASARRPAPPPRSSTTACASGSARTSCRSRAGSRSSRPPTRAGLRSTATVMFGHIEEPWELAEHMRVVRDAAGAHRRHHRVRAAVVHPVPHAARPHARRRGDLARGEPQAHRRLPPRARPHDPQPPGELGEDGPRRRHRVAALGRQRPRRHADGGVDQPPGRQLPRRPPRPARADRRRPPRPAAPPPSARRSTGSGPSTRSPPRRRRAARHPPNGGKRARRRPWPPAGEGYDQRL